MSKESIVEINMNDSLQDVIRKSNYNFKNCSSSQRKASTLMVNQEAERSDAALAAAVTSFNEAIGSLVSRLDDLGDPITIAHGGTGATTAANALHNLGINWGTSEPPATGTPNTLYIQILTE